MEKEVRSSSFPTKKKFGHCKIDWVIDHFFLQIIKKDWVIRSPEFTVNGSEETKWGLILRPKSNVRNYALSFNLKRSISDTGPEVVRVNLRMYLSGSDSGHHHINDVLFSLKKGSEYEMCLEITELIREMKAFPSDSLRIECKMIVYSEDTSDRFKECNDAAIKLLSENMLNLFASGQNSDTKLMFGNNVILAHKTILYSRNELLSILIGEEDDSIEGEEIEDYVIIDLPDTLDYQGMRKMLAYLYSGDLKHVIGEPSHAIYDCAEFFEINEIEDYYEPDELTLRSLVDVHQFTFVFLITDLKRDNGEWQYTIDFNTEDFATMCQLHFHSRSKEDAYYVALFAKNLKGNGAVKASLEFAVVDQSDHYLLTRFFDSVTNHKYISIDGEVERDLLKPYSANSILRAIIKLKLSTDAKSSYIEKQMTSSRTCADEEFCYKCLSMDIEDIFDGGPFSDVVVDNNSVYFSVHKCILASRCHFFSDILTEAEDGESVVISNIDAHTLCMLLTYIYSGVLLDMDDDDLIKVYKASVLFSLPLLRTMCSDRIKLCSETNTNIRCGVIKIAEENEDKPLKLYVLNLLYNTAIPLPVPNQLFSFVDVHICRYF